MSPGSTVEGQPAAGEVEDGIDGGRVRLRGVGAPWRESGNASAWKLTKEKEVEKTKTSMGVKRTGAAVARG